MASDQVVPAPWAPFLADLDAHLTEPTELHCLGGFVVSIVHGLERPTADIDVLASTSGTDAAALARLAGKGSRLHKRHKVYLDIVTIATVPERYEERLVEFARGRFTRLTLKALEAHDVVLAKLERNIDRDREDLKRLAASGHVDADTLRQRYANELRPLLGRPEREDLTLQLWIEIVNEVRAKETPRLSAATQLPRPTSLDAQLRFAIANKRLLRMVYNGKARVVEPHDYGRHNGQPRLLAYQLYEMAVSRQPRTKGWRLLDLAKSESCEVLSETFPGSRGDDHQRHYTWDELYARVS